MKHIKKIFAKIASIFPEILMFFSIFCLILSLTLGVSEIAKYESRAEALATENTYLKKEIEWFKAQLKDTFPVCSDRNDVTNGDSNE